MMPLVAASTTINRAAYDNAMRHFSDMNGPWNQSLIV
jgi:hypothetical protein